MTLGEFLDAGRYSPVFVDRYLIPMAGAVWSMAPEVMPMFPAVTLIRFMQNHGMLGINTHPQWKVIRGGSHSYFAPLTVAVPRTYYQGRDHHFDRAFGSRRDACNSRIEPAQQFDEVVFACHGDQILPLLAQPTEAEREVLSCFTTSRNETCLHTDSTLLPKRAAARASWNYLLGDSGKVTMTYHMNRLQSLQTRGRLLRHFECQRPRQSRTGAAPDGLRASAIHTGGDSRARTVGRHQREEPHAFLRSVLVLRLPRGRRAERHAGGRSFGGLLLYDSRTRPLHGHAAASPLPSARA